MLATLVAAAAGVRRRVLDVARHRGHVERHVVGEPAVRPSDSNGTGTHDKPLGAPGLVAGNGLFVRRDKPA